MDNNGEIKIPEIGSRFRHEEYGEGTVTYVGEEFFGVKFDEGGQILLRRNEFGKGGMPDESSPKIPEPTSWPESTFTYEREEGHHFLGSHWEPFVDDRAEIFGRLPEILPDALVATGFAESRKPARREPTEWPAGFILNWPLRVQGMSMVIRVDDDANNMVSLFPFYATGSQHTLVVKSVNVWESGLEAQITATWGESEVCFFDTQYPINRIWYERNETFDFILTGIAYNARPAENREMKIRRHPEEVEWVRRELKLEGPLAEPEYNLSLEGAAFFLPVEDWDVDEYRFHAPVKEVTTFTDWLGQDGWKVRATVMRFDEGEADLDILITRRAWHDDEPPRVGQDIEGRLWLQGYLWMPKVPWVRR